MNIYKKLTCEINLLSLSYKGDDYDAFQQNQLLGKITLALEVNLITYEEWEELTEKVWNIGAKLSI